MDGDQLAVRWWFVVGGGCSGDLFEFSCLGSLGSQGEKDIHS